MGRRLLRWSAVALVGLWACSGRESVEPADRAAFVSHLVWPVAAPNALGLRLGDPRPVAGGELFPARFALAPGLDAHGAVLRPTQPTGAGVVVAQGHFGEGKSSPEAQEIALRLVQRGAVVVLVDTPGMEEAASPGRFIHFDDGAHNRALLSAGGTSAMALQVALLRRGLDVLEAEGATHLGATGASGGAVQSLYLGLVDPRVSAVVLASFPPTPREARAGGCPCDQVPGWPGPDPSVGAALSVPSLWLRDGPGDPPPGLPALGRHVETAGPHSYTTEMQTEALAFFAEHLPLQAPADPGPDGLGPAPIQPIRAQPLAAADLSLADVSRVLTPTRLWTPGKQGRGAHELSCRGTGPAVVVVGGNDLDLDALVAAGAKACAVRIPIDAVGHDEAVGTGGPAYVDALSGALATAAARVDAKAAWGVRGWGLVAAGTGLPYVVRDPVKYVYDVNPEVDAPWIHVPGAWWGVLPPVWAAAVAVGTDPAVLAGQLVPQVTPESAPSP